MLDSIMENLGSLMQQLRLTWALILDDRVPAWTKVIPIGVIIYAVSPFDIVPDLVLALGQVDDLLILVAGLQLFERLAPPSVVSEHRARLNLHHPKPNGDEKPKNITPLNHETNASNY